MSSKMSFTIETVECDISEEQSYVYERMTKYEYTKILAERIKQLNAGETPLVNCDNEFDNLCIAEKELRQRVIPLVIKRTDNRETKTIKISNIVISNY